MTHEGKPRQAHLKWYCLVLCSLIVGNCCMTAPLGGRRVRRFSDGTEFANTGDAWLLLWTRSGEGSIAWDCLPGLIPEFRVTESSVFIVFPLWILLIPIGLLTVFLFWRDRKRLKARDC